MKKIISVCLAVVLIFSCITVTGFAAEESEIPAAEEIVIPGIDTDDEQLQKINSTVSSLITYIYDYATKPQEPAVELETVLMIASIIVSIVYTVYKNRQTQQTA